MKILPIYFNSKNTKFCSKQCYSTEKWTELRDILVHSDRYEIEKKEDELKNYVPSFNKSEFEYSDYESLSPKERLIIRILNKKGAKDKCYYTHRENLSIEKDAERVLELAKNVKEFLDRKYKDGYKLVGIGKSPEALVETMQLLGADTTVIPFSKTQIEVGNRRDFPYEHLVPDLNHIHKLFSTNFGPIEKCSVKDWEGYFKYYGIEKDFCKKTGKALIFTDYVYKGNTKKYFESILNGLGFGNNYEFINALDLFHGIELQLNYNLPNCFHSESFKSYAKMESPSYYYKEIDIIKHPEYIPSLPERLESKLFRCALYDLIKKK